MEFQKWLLQKYLDWQAEQGRPRTEVDFAEYLGVKQQSLSAWLRGYYAPKGYLAVKALVAKYGREVYTALGAETPLQPELEEAMARLSKVLADLPEQLKEFIFLTFEQAIREKFWEHPDGPDVRFLQIMKVIVDKEKEEEEKEGKNRPADSSKTGEKNV
jgi:transcriptional regulator with XRE-family HTH domain